MADANVPQTTPPTNDRTPAAALALSAAATLGAVVVFALLAKNYRPAPAATTRSVYGRARRLRAKGLL